MKVKSVWVVWSWSGCEPKPPDWWMWISAQVEEETHELSGVFW